ncbi:MAG: 30S ribosomal protein S1 [Candidatus Marinimicrobia bacterium]|jgi:small subunit ribosomal protein S1|nr:30S ribosomal protein S1 [Candidatus Neomarinimicrobiota bacterium]MBT3948093.1 30S ribosomal protein S1 [Candidatus Neomarinimicrobiota bacterium]MBT4307340.1 30S ribosomal protein S1 [Candidatus Neomarinimicrobiota bacterium]MBT4736436.1 30S ribosomal protein S1 [Candidatus Neomarinimicrobiota bacterium]MBT5387158.1 30S ribosomal protein S1 [Candidatus Neomarinimicrobiota bacterium]
MSEIEQKPVVEQTEDSLELSVSADVVEEAPTTSNGVNPANAEMPEADLSSADSPPEESTEVDTPAEEAKAELNYLGADLFNDVRKVSMEDLLNSEVTEDVPQEEQDRYLSTFSEINEREIVTGRVIGMNEKEILIDIGFKSEGVIHRDEFTEDNLPEVGEKLDVYLERMEDESGKTVLSKEKADFLRRWTELRNHHETGEIISGRIIRRIKGGMIVDLNGVQAFLPGSQIDVRPVKDFDKYINSDIDLRVVKFNEFRKNVVVSHKAILEESMAEQRDELFDKLEVGSVMEGRVKNITDFGVFIDLGGIDGLLHITDLSWGRVSHPSELIGMDDTLTVKIIDFDQEKKRVSLGLKQLTPHPWDNVDERYPEGTNINGKIVSMTNYGAFVEIEPGIEGLVHVSEMSWTRHIKNPSEMYSLGDEVEAVVLAIDSEDRKISLGAKQLQDDPWDQIEEKYMVGTIVKGKVINLTQFGAFVELEEGIDGLIHVSDLSWTKIVRHPKEIIEKDQEVEVRVLEVSRESRRIALGLKQVSDDPWPELVKQFETGKEVEGEIVRVLDKGVILILDNDVEGIIPFGRQPKRQRKALSSKYNSGQKMIGVVMEVKPDDKKVVLFSDELSADKPDKIDDVEEYLKSQEEIVGETIEIPSISTEETESDSEPEVE